MAAMDKPNIVRESPSAPPSEVEHNGQGLPDTRSLEQTTNLRQAPPIYNPQSSQTSNVEPSSNQAPPPYQEAVNYPSYRPSSVPKPQSNVPQIYPPASYSNYPHYNATGGAAPASYVIQTAVPPQPTVTVITAGNCAFCLSGRVEPETDLCCLLCLIVLAIFTFPFGLVLLCCIPCTTRRRCTHCRRLNG